MLSKEELAAIGKPKVCAVDIEGVGQVGVVEISGADYTALQSAAAGKDQAAGVESYKYGHLAACLVDADGKRLFANASEVRAFAESVTNKVFESICEAVAKHNGLAASVEDVAKN